MLLANVMNGRTDHCTATLKQS